jgi:type III secretion protein U
MTRTESKREVKDLEGDPLIRGARRRMRQQLTSASARVGMRHAVIAVTHGERIVGLRYRPGETPIPLVVCKGRGEAAMRMLAEARDLGLPIVDNAELVAALATRHAVGATVVPDLFGPVAELLVAAGFS